MVKGTIKVIGETQSFGTGDFTKREVVVTTDEQYPQMINIEFVKDKCELLDLFNIGDQVEVEVNLRGREWINPEGVAKYFNSIQGWRITKISGEQTKEGTPAPIDSGAPDDLPL